MFKRFSFLFFCFIAFTFAKAQTFEVDGIQYTIINGTTNVEVRYNSDFESTSVEIPSTVTSNGKNYNVIAIGMEAFSNNYFLTSIKIPNSVTSIGSEAFYGCGTLTSITFSNSITSIGDDAFLGCKGLTSLTLPNSVVSLGSFAFAACTGLTSFTLSNSLTSIGQGAFYNCIALTSIICENPTPITIDSSVFSNVNQSSCSLTVPAGSVAAYQAADVWQDFNPIIGDSSLNTSEINTKNNVVLYPNPVHNEAILEIKNSENANLEVYDMNGKMVLRKSLNNNSKNTINTSNLPKGVYLFKTISDKNSSVKKVIKN